MSDVMQQAIQAPPQTKNHHIYNTPIHATAFLQKSWSLLDTNRRLLESVIKRQTANANAHIMRPLLYFLLFLLSSVSMGEMYDDDAEFPLSNRKFVTIRTRTEAPTTAVEPVGTAGTAASSTTAIPSPTPTPKKTKKKAGNKHKSATRNPSADLHPAKKPPIEVCPEAHLALVKVAKGKCKFQHILLALIGAH
ncbi:hypothetical protein AMATHDRAFT_2878 [Amanita thiersii Skay4041]|uniref:Uncharacterized protein n=1 Tax=Amanita thiersii Skay4041 TaxID=703135 RepID=A0A2A9NM28_9AGAR|nr:hypothetical protein AMATHDRAFT_2878 [Amanita thiersii Skay4041]